MSQSEFNFRKNIENVHNMIRGEECNTYNDSVNKAKSVRALVASLDNNLTKFTSRQG